MYVYHEVPSAFVAPPGPKLQWPVVSADAKLPLSGCFSAPAR